MGCLVYDDRCGFCRALAGWLKRRDRRGALRLVPREGAGGDAILARHPGLRQLDAVAWVAADRHDGRERTWARSEAILRAVGELGGPWRLAAALARALPQRARDAVYDAVARRRRRDR